MKLQLKSFFAFCFLACAFEPAAAAVVEAGASAGFSQLLQIDAASLVKTRIDLLRDDVRRVLREQKAVLSGGITIMPSGLKIRIPDATERGRVSLKMQEFAHPLGDALDGTASSTFNLEEQGDGEIWVILTETGQAALVKGAIEQSVAILRQRLEGIGVKGARVVAQGNERILAEIPAVQNPQQIRDLLSATAKLELRIAAAPGADPNDFELLIDRGTGNKIPVLKQVAVLGEDVIDAQAVSDSVTGSQVVRFRLNVRGGVRLAQVTKDNFARQLAIVFDNVVISAPLIRSPITGGEGIISGNFTLEQAANLAVWLRSGALPARLALVEERTPVSGPDAAGPCPPRAKRFALVVGNSAYPKDAALTNPGNDADDVAKLLREKLCFTVIEAKDATRDIFGKKIGEFAEAAQGADVALFYYAGHGMQFQQTNYLLPVDARLSNEYDAIHNNVSAQDIVALLETRAKVTLMFLDACRNNPLESDFRRRMTALGRGPGEARGLAAMSSSNSETLVVFATRPNQTAEDGAGRNSPFTQAFLQYFATPDRDIELVMRDMGSE